MVKPIENIRRNVTGNNWYSLVELVNEHSEKGLTYVGTLKKNIKEIPHNFLPNKKRGVKTSVYGFTEDMKLVSSVPKKSKAAILISSMHHSVNNDPESGKPETILFYNTTKGGVDCLHQRCSLFVKSLDKKIFFTLVDVACSVNFYVVHQAYPKAEVMMRLSFMKTLARDLVEPHTKRRISIGCLPQELSDTIRRILHLQDEPQTSKEEFGN
ncbi:uncharacterized protein LOC126199439 [Schistocerca nitens]|uniref:uncharacterized protein LOC126199439 n=1 Tax=Schistocerca nitens TaxID=7011 RepID=UPI0021194328|nr:uncharacterized protein LOC126199439 [Schistocerca nitens]